jgi:hypothetical protein
MVCVASLNKAGSPSEFTNIPLVSNVLVFAPGEKIIAPIPNLWCPSEAMNSLSSKLTQKQLKALAKQIKKDCPKEIGANLAPLSGTSMSSPLIARALALESLKFTRETQAKEIIANFLNASERTQFGPLSVAKFRLPVPSWYPQNEDTQGLGLNESALTRGYFEFYFKK